MLDPADIVAIQQVLSEMHHIVDGQRWSELDAVFAPDAEYDLSYRGLPAVKGVENIAKFMEETTRRDYAELVSHNTVNTVVKQDPDGTVRAHSKLMVLMSDGRALAADLHDVLVRSPAGWRVQRRSPTPRQPAGASWKTAEESR